MKKLFKKVVAYICAAAMVIATMAGTGTIVNAEDDVLLNNLQKTFGKVGTGYTYTFASLDGYHEGYKYLILTYQGNIKGLRFEISNVVDNNDVEKTDFTWVDQEQPVHFTLVGEPDLTTAESSSVVIDLEASGIDIGKYNSMHVHVTDIITIGTARLSNSPDLKDTDVEAKLPEPEPETPDPTTLEPVTLTEFVKEWNSVAAEGYEYLGEVKTGVEVAGYRYLKLTYTGDATAFNDLRLGMNDKAYGFVNPYDGQLVTVDGTAVPAPTAEEQTVVIDLVATGVDTTQALTSIHVHQTGGNGNFAVKDAQLLPPEKEEPVELEPITLNDENEPFMKEWAPEEGLEDGAYAYLGHVNVGAPAGYKYLQITYTGDEKAFSELRLEFEGGPTAWFTENAQGTIKTVDDTLVPAPKAEEQTVLIDLAASGVDVTKAINGWHVHQTAGNGKFTIVDAKLLPKLPPEEYIILNGDEQGLSSMLKSWTIKEGTPYQYLGFVTLREPAAVHKYLILTYAGDIASLRFEFAQVVDGEELYKSAPYWFDQEGQENHFVTADGTPIPLNGGIGTTVVIDLEKSGIVLGDINSVYMHAGYAEEKKAIQFGIGMARLSTNTEIIDSLDMMPSDPLPPPTTQAPTTVAPTTKAPVKVTKPAKSKIAKVTPKKKAAKVVKLSLKRIKKAKGYEVTISTTKKFKKVLVKKFVKKLKVKVTSKKLKNKKKLYVRARAYVLNGKKKVFGKYSNVKKVRIRK